MRFARAERDERREREAQLEVRSRLVVVVSQALEAFGRRIQVARSCASGRGTQAGR